MFSLSGFANELVSCPPKAACEPCKPVTCKNLCVPITVCDKWDNQGWNLGVRGDVLYMNYNSPVLTYASQRSVQGTVLNSDILPVKGKMSLGCNLAFNYTMEEQPGYSFEFSWYYMNAKFSDSQSGTVLLAHSVSLNEARPGSVSVDAHLKINLFDLMIQKNFGVGGWFTVMPSVGLVGGYIDSVSKGNTASTSGSFFAGTPASTVTSADLDQFANYEGIGLKMGGRSTFKMWGGLRLTADLFYSVMYGYTKNSLEFSQAPGLYAAAYSATLSDYDHHHGVAFFDSMLGLAWECRFCNDSKYLDIHAGWRFQSYDAGWMEFEAEFNDAVQALPLHGQGLQAGATFKF